MTAGLTLQLAQDSQRSNQDWDFGGCKSDWPLFRASGTMTSICECQEMLWLGWFPGRWSPDAQSWLDTYCFLHLVSKNIDLNVSIPVTLGIWTFALLRLTSSAELKMISRLVENQFQKYSESNLVICGTSVTQSASELRRRFYSRWWLQASLASPFWSSLGRKDRQLWFSFILVAVLHQSSPGEKDFQVCAITSDLGRGPNFHLRRYWTGK